MADCSCPPPAIIEPCTVENVDRAALARFYASAHVSEAEKLEMTRSMNERAKLVMIPTNDWTLVYCPGNGKTQFIPK
jgi:hypothetical protein